MMAMPSREQSQDRDSGIKLISFEHELHEFTRIMKKAKDAVKRQLKEQWKQSCNGFLVELLRMWELDAHYGYWIGDETGSVYDYGDGMFTINMDDIIYCVLADVTREQYIEWQEYICDAAEFGFDTPNLRSFVRGCPRTSAETFKHLREIKAMLNDAIQDEKERVKNEPNTPVKDGLFTSIVDMLPEDREYASVKLSDKQL